MTREEVYTKNMKFHGALFRGNPALSGVSYILPQELIDAIIDCAVEEVLRKLETTYKCEAKME